ncbi:MAG TPA: acyloxyacyl hydrolase [Thermoanaerobaculia bacterium]
MRIYALSACVFLAILLLAVPAESAPIRLGAPEYVAASSGVFEALRNGDAREIGGELRFAPRRLKLLPRFVPDLIPVAGFMAGSQGTLYFYGGFRVDYPLGERWVATPSWGVGLYERADGKRLGGPLEFRSGIELAYRLRDGSRLGVCLYHLSNAGLFDFNPGSESLVLTYSAGLRRQRR